MNYEIDNSLKEYEKIYNLKNNNSLKKSNKSKINNNSSIEKSRNIVERFPNSIEEANKNLENNLNIFGINSYLNRKKKEHFTNKSASEIANDNLRKNMEKYGIQNYLDNMKLGLQGNRGRRGEEGDLGEMGPQGQIGNVGAQGDKGVVGIMGPIGPPGPPGDVGKNGTKGKQGKDGQRGDRGAEGPQGFKGKRGTKGNTGLQGPIGQRGDPGDKGEKGDRGENGYKGIFTMKYNECEYTPWTKNNDNFEITCPENKYATKIETSCYCNGSNERLNFGSLADRAKPSPPKMLVRDEESKANYSGYDTISFMKNKKRVPYFETIKKDLDESNYKDVNYYTDKTRTRPEKEKCGFSNTKNIDRDCMHRLKCCPVDIYDIGESENLLKNRIFMGESKDPDTEERFINMMWINLPPNDFKKKKTDYPRGMFKDVEDEIDKEEEQIHYSLNCESKFCSKVGQLCVDNKVCKNEINEETECLKGPCWHNIPDPVNSCMDSCSMEYLGQYCTKGHINKICNLEKNDKCTNPPCWNNVPVLDKCAGSRCPTPGQQCSIGSTDYNLTGFICKNEENKMSYLESEWCHKPPCWHKASQETENCSQPTCNIIGQKCVESGVPKFICLDKPNNNCTNPPCWHKINDDSVCSSILTSSSGAPTDENNMECHKETKLDSSGEEVLDANGNPVQSYNEECVNKYNERKNTPVDEYGNLCPTSESIPVDENGNECKPTMEPVKDAEGNEVKDADGNVIKYPKTNECINNFNAKRDKCISEFRKRQNSNLCVRTALKDTKGNVIKDADGNDIQIFKNCDFEGDCENIGQRCTSGGSQKYECMATNKFMDNVLDSFNRSKCNKTPCWVPIQPGADSAYFEFLKIVNGASYKVENQVSALTELKNARLNNIVYQFTDEDREGYVTFEDLKKFMQKNWTIYEANSHPVYLLYLWKMFTGNDNTQGEMKYEQFGAMIRRLKVEKFKYRDKGLDDNGDETQLGGRIAPIFMPNEIYYSIRDEYPDLDESIDWMSKNTIEANTCPNIELDSSGDEVIKNEIFPYYKIASKFNCDEVHFKVKGSMNDFTDKNDLRDRLCGQYIGKNLRSGKFNDENNAPIYEIENGCDKFYKCGFKKKEQSGSNVKIFCKSMYDNTKRPYPLTGTCGTISNEELKVADNNDCTKVHETWDIIQAKSGGDGGISDIDKEGNIRCSTMVGYNGEIGEDGCPAYGKCKKISKKEVGDKKWEINCGMPDTTDTITQATSCTGGTLDTLKKAPNNDCSQIPGIVYDIRGENDKDDLGKKLCGTYYGFKNLETESNGCRKKAQCKSRFQKFYGENVNMLTDEYKFFCGSGDNDLTSTSNCTPNVDGKTTYTDELSEEDPKPEVTYIVAPDKHCYINNNEFSTTTANKDKDGERECNKYIGITGELDSNGCPKYSQCKLSTVSKLDLRKFKLRCKY